MSREGSGAVLGIDKTIFKQLMKANPLLKPYEDTYRYGNENSPIRLPVRMLSKKLLDELRGIYMANGGHRKFQWPIKQIDAHLAVLDDPKAAVMTKLRPFETALIAYIRQNIINGWVFIKNKDTGILQAYLVYDVVYTPAYKDREGNYYPAKVRMTLGWWEKNGKRHHTFTWHESDIRGQTVGAILSKRDIFHETKELVALYEKDEKRFLKWRQMLGEQFVGHGRFEAGDDDDDDDDDDQNRNRHTKLRDSNLRGTRLIVDDRCDEIENHMATMIFRGHEVETDEQQDTGEEIEEGADTYTRLPLGNYVWCFNLNSHRGGWVYIDHMNPYVYRPELREKLILAPEHEDLIDALTADMGVLMEDVVSGKSGGTAILCQGKAGTGKTLTAEVYAEVIKRPLYRVHSGQLGTDAETVENALKNALDSATRWRALLLIDEADVFVSTRNDDMEKNAVVGVFLRLLEYYDGVVFMTTNRVDTVDEAILSRCIAQVNYSMPGVKERERIWLTLGGVYGMKLVESKGMARQLAEMFECSGRDIKGLIRLVTKYARQHKKKPEVADFKRLALFKGLTPK